MKLSMRQYAIHRGVSVQAVSKAVKEGRIKLGRDKKIDVAKADKEWAANTNTRAGSDPAVAGLEIPTYAESRAAREAYAALREKQLFELEAKTLVPRDQVTKILQAIIATARAKLLAMPNSLAPLVAVENDERKCQTILAAGVREALDELSDQRNYRIGDLDLGTTA